MSKEEYTKKEVDKKLRNLSNNQKKSFFSLLDDMTSKLNDTSGNWTVIGADSMGINNNPKTDVFLKEYTEWNYANINAIAKAVSDIVFKLFKYDENKDEVEEIKEHEILELLYKVNPEMTKNEFIFILEANSLMAGEAPIRLRRKSNRSNTEIPYELHPVNPSQLKVFVGANKDGFEMITKYEIADPIKPGQKLELNPWELILIKDPNPNNPFRGAGVIEAAARTIDTLNFAEEYNRKFFQNSAIPLTVLYTEQELNDRIIKTLRENWNKNYRGVDNAFKTAILEKGLKMERLQTASKDMEFLEQQKFLRDKLMAMYKTTKVVLGIVEDVNRANAEASEYIFMKYCVKPRMRRIVDYLNEYLMPLFDPDGKQGLFLDFEDPIEEDKTQQYAQYTQAVDKWMTKNEVRDELGLPSLEGGDEIWQPAGLAPMGSIPQVTPTAETPIEEGSEEIGDETNPIEEVPAEDGKVMQYRILRVNPKDRAKQSAKKYAEQILKLKNRNVRLKQIKRLFLNELKKVIKTQMKAKSQKPMPKYKDFTSSESHLKFSENQISISEKAETKIIKGMDEKIYIPQSKEIIANIKQRGTKFLIRKGTKDSSNQYMPRKDKWVEAGIDLMTPIIEELMLLQGQEALDLLGKDMTYNMLDEARKFLNKNMISVSKTVTQTIFDKIRESLSEGIKNGEGEKELIDRVRKGYSSLKEYQAQAIARTETTRATTFATIDAYKQSGVVKGKQWLTAHDERLCEFCRKAAEDFNKEAIDKVLLKKGDKYTGADGGEMEITYSDVIGPPLHVNCRCNVLPILEEIKSPSIVKPKAEELLEKIEKELDGIQE